MMDINDSGRTDIPLRRSPRRPSLRPPGKPSSQAPDQPSGGSPRRPSRRGRLAAALLLSAGGVASLLALLIGTAELDVGGRGPWAGSSNPAEAAVVSPGVGVAPTASPTGTASPAPSDPTSPSRVSLPVLRLSGPVPSAGTGDFGYSAGSGLVLGSGGRTPLRYRVAAEIGSAEDVPAFAAIVDLVLGDPQSWIGDRRLRLQRVPGSARHDFTVYLATGRTAQRMCAAGGVDIQVGGRPYTSCRAPGKVIINLDRWRRSVDHFVDAGIPLDTYRAYVLNHEVGHQLGHRHESCPGSGRLAPVMMQQTLFLNGCTANPWSHPSGRRYVGPPL